VALSIRKLGTNFGNKRRLLSWLRPRSLV
jgi:hypothetical protein